MLSRMYEIFLSHYGEPHWWPAKTPYEVIVGAVLTQNCAWSNVEKAIANFEDNLTPETVACIDTDKLIDIIRPAGFYNQKVAYLKAVTAWFAGYGCNVSVVSRKPLDKIRSELLSTKGRSDVKLSIQSCCMLSTFRLSWWMHIPSGSVGVTPLKRGLAMNRSSHILRVIFPKALKCITGFMR